MTDHQRAQFLYDEWLEKLKTVATTNMAMRVWKAARTSATIGTIREEALSFMICLQACGKCQVAYHRFSEIKLKTGRKAA